MDTSTNVTQSERTCSLYTRGKGQNKPQVRECWVQVTDVRVTRWIWRNTLRRGEIGSMKLKFTRKLIKNFTDSRVNPSQITGDTAQPSFPPLCLSVFPPDVSSSRSDTSVKGSITGPPPRPWLPRLILSFCLHMTGAELPGPAPFIDLRGSSRRTAPVCWKHLCCLYASAFDALSVWYYASRTWLQQITCKTIDDSFTHQWAAETLQHHLHSGMLLLVILWAHDGHEMTSLSGGAFHFSIGDDPYLQDRTGRLMLPTPACGQIQTLHKRPACVISYCLEEWIKQTNKNRLFLCAHA